MRWKAVLPAVLLTALLTGCGGQNMEPPAGREEVPVQESPAEEPAVQEPAMGPPAGDRNALPKMAEGLPDWAAAYFEQVLADNTEMPEAEYALIDLTGGNIPALAAGLGGCVSLYQYGSGELHTLMDHWTYGCMGKYEYEYLPAQNVIRNLRSCNANIDAESAIFYSSYFFVKEDYTLDTYTLTLWNFADKNHSCTAGEDERFGKAACYYWNDQEITEEAYKSYCIDGDVSCIDGGFLYICGDTPCSEFLKQLNGLAGK